LLIAEWLLRDSITDDGPQNCCWSASSVARSRGRNWRELQQGELLKQKPKSWKAMRMGRHMRLWRKAS